MKNTARNKQIVFFAESRKTAKFKLFLEKAKKGHSGEFLDIQNFFGSGPQKQFLCNQPLQAVIYSVDAIFHKFCFKILISLTDYSAMYDIVDLYQRKDGNKQRESVTIQYKKTKNTDSLDLPGEQSYA